MLSDETKKVVAEVGFVELEVEDVTDERGRMPSWGCSFGCSTAKCSLTATFAGTDEEWAKFLELEGGTIQY